MHTSDFQPNKEALREIVLAQLAALKQYGVNKRVPFEEQKLELQQIRMRLQHKYVASGTPHYSVGSPQRSNVLSASSLLQQTVNTRRLPPIFAEQQKNYNEIRDVCTNLSKTLTDLEEGIFYGGKRGNTSSSAFLGEATLQLLQRRARRKAITKMQDVMKNNQQQLRQDDDYLSDDTIEATGEVPLDWIDEVQRARLAAADEGLSTEQSVSDYAEDPVAPRFVLGRQLQDEVEEIDESLRKVSECVATVLNIDECDAGNSWWESAMRTREMKTTGVRLNYHARRIIRWNQCAREHFLLEAVTSNEQMERCRADLTYLREQQDLFQTRIESCNKAHADAVAEAAALQEALNQANYIKSELQKKLLARAHEKHLLPCDCEDILLAELLLLLEHISWPAALQSDADRVKKWIFENVIPLDV